MPFIDARTLPNQHQIDADVCVIGAGAAGLAIASELAGRSVRVALVESGGLDPDKDTQDLNRGEIVGQPYFPLVTASLRLFGGTTNHWSAFVQQLQPIDFELRPWVQHSGWPIAYADLAPYYERAARFLHLPKRPFDVSAWREAGRYGPLPFHEERVRTTMIQVMPAEARRLGTTQRATIRDASNIDTYVFANALELVPDPDRQRVIHVRLATLTGRRFTAKAKHFIAAAGGLGNPRLLLLSSSVQTEGLGNEKDLVGRFFANHLEAPVGDLYLSDGSFDPGLYLLRPQTAGQAMAALMLSAAAQRAENLLDAEFWIRPHPSSQVSGRTPLESSLSRLGSLGVQRYRSDLRRHIATVIADVDHLGARPQLGVRLFRLGIVAEQAPNPASRVTLGEDHDALGQRRLRLDWRLSQLDSVSVQRSVHVLAREVGAAGLGRVRTIFPDMGFQAVSPLGSYHHMGTTRMHVDPRRGVVDQNCRLHGLPNLYVAGSSVFPTGGAVNPTLSIIALALRLSDHLRATHR